MAKTYFHAVISFGNKLFGKFPGRKNERNDLNHSHCFAPIRFYVLCIVQRACDPKEV
jgi:hypothetical protein